jgi:hypothetical protein
MVEDVPHRLPGVVTFEEEDDLTPAEKDRGAFKLRRGVLA